MRQFNKGVHCSRYREVPRMWILKGWLGRVSEESIDLICSGNIGLGC